MSGLRTEPQITYGRRGGLRCPCCAWEFTNEIQPPPESAISPESMEELIDSILKVMRDAGEL
jgi:hypothetical protein